MSEEAFDLVKGSLARRKQSATTVMLAEPTPHHRMQIRFKQQRIEQRLIVH